MSNLHDFFHAASVPQEVEERGPQFTVLQENGSYIYVQSLGKKWNCSAKKSQYVRAICYAYVWQKL